MIKRRAQSSHLWSLSLRGIVLTMALGLMAPVGQAWAQDTPAAAATSEGSAEGSASGQAAGDGYTKPASFKGTSSNEDMKYRNLWIAYAAIWILVFGFIWRTWSKQQSTAQELNDLRKRLNALDDEGGV
ncbi:MAG: CcmD family protein [Bradymonadia bacterium]